MQIKTIKMLNSAFFIAMGIVLPFGFHISGMGGTIFLPMHIPVLIAGLMLGPYLGALVGMITVVLSTLLTGMPPVIPMLPIMFFELGVYGFLTGFFFKRKGMNIWGSLILTMIGGRMAAGLVVWVLVHMGGFEQLPVNFLVFIYGSILKGFPGIVVQLIFIPLLFKFLIKAGVVEERRKYRI